MIARSDHQPLAYPGAGEIAIEWATLVVDAMADAGVRDVVVSPGSRSTPLVLAAIRNPRLTTHDVVDERSAAFFALGVSRATGRPAILVCTSGTAGAHWFPAVIEARMSGVPLVAITADRTLEEIACAASQAIDQTRLFGEYARFVDLGTPDPHPAALRGVRRAAAQAVHDSLHPAPGPVHLNARFRKPLEPTGVADPKLLDAVRALRAVPATRAFAPVAVPDPEAIREVAEACASAKRGLIAVGPMPAWSAAREAVESLARATGFPLLCESASQARHGGSSLSHFEAWLSPRVAPDLLLQVGAPPVSAAWARLWSEGPGLRYAIAAHGWNDPASRATAVVEADPGLACSALAGALTKSSLDRAWAQSLARLDARAARLASAELDRGFFEGSIARAVLARAPAGSLLALGNSLPIREIDLWCGARSAPLTVLAQRGAAGIDGLIAGTIGAAAAARTPATLFVGDVSFAHDVASLACGDALDVPFAVVVVNNGGGRIFERLPIAKAVDAPELAHWTTPPRLDIEAASRAFDARFARVKSEPALAAALDEAHRREGTTVIEAVVAADEGIRRAKALVVGLGEE